MFGEIPLVSVDYVDGKGQTRQLFDYDPNYEPPLPRGAVRGDIRKQAFCRMCHTPYYFYVDVERTCAQCGRAFVFSGAEQKHWFETLKFHADAHPIRCLPCRRKRRSELALQRQAGAARAALRASPDDPAALVALAEAVVRCFERRLQGPLAEAIAASRKVRRLLRDHPAREHSEALFWEGLAQALAGRADAARTLLGSYLEVRGGGRRHTALAKEARLWLERNAAATGARARAESK